MSHVSELHPRDPQVAHAQRSLLDGQRLSPEEGLRLYDSPLLELF